MSELRKRTCNGKNKTESRYWTKPSKIKVNIARGHCICPNCGGQANDVDYYHIWYNQTDHVTAKGNEGKYLHPKPQIMVLCEDCMEELLQAIQTAKDERK